MREIKLRAWDKIEKKMWNRVGISLYGVQVYADNDEFPEKLIVDRGQDCFEIMQFIGLKDNNGKAIYEGDICKHRTVNDDGEFEDNWENTEIWFGKGCFYTRYYGFPVHSFACNKNIEIEVIGNIYDNPELLEVRAGLEVIDGK